MKKVKKIAKLIALNIMVFHDEKRYGELEKNSEKIVELSGYVKPIAKIAGKKIKKIYLFYDKADEYNKSGNFEKEKEEYKKARKVAEELNKLLQVNYDCRAMVDWVVNWRHKKFAKAAEVFVNDWEKKTGSKLSALKCAHYIYRAGKYHDSRKIKEFEKQFEKVYHEVSKSREKKLPIFF